MLCKNSLDSLLQICGDFILNWRECVNGHIGEQIIEIFLRQHLMLRILAPPHLRLHRFYLYLEVMCL